MDRRLAGAAVFPLGLVGVAGLAQFLRRGVESGLLALVPGVLALSVYGLLRARRADARPADLIPHGVSAVAAFAALFLYPVPPQLASAFSALLLVGAAIAARDSTAASRLGRGIAAHHRGIERAVVAGLFVLAIASWSASFELYNAFDEGLETHSALEILAGRVPFRDYYCYKLPGHDLLLACWLKLGGGASLGGIRSFSAFLGLVSLSAVAVLAFRVFPARERLAWLAFATFLLVPTFRVATHWNLGICMGLWACALAVWGAQRRSTPVLVLAGLAAGVATLGTWSLGLLVTAALPCALAFGGSDARRARLRRALTVFAPALLPPAVLVGGLLALGAGEALGRDLIAQNASGYVSFNVGHVPYFNNGWPLFPRSLQALASGRVAWGTSWLIGLTLLGVGMPLVTLLALGDGARALRRKVSPQRLLLAGGAVAFFVSAFSLPIWQAIQRTSALGVGYALLLWLVLKPRTPRAARWLVPCALFCVGLVLALDDAGTAFARRDQATFVVNARGDRVGLPTEDSAADFTRLQHALADIPGDGGVLILFHEPGLHYHFDCAPWYRAPNYIPGYFLDGEAVAKRLRADPPSAIVYSERYVRASYRFKDPRFLRHDESFFFGSPVIRAIKERDEVGRFDGLTFGDGAVTLYR